MILFVGLGNPGKEYANTRHNAGFIVADILFSRRGGTLWRRRFDGLFAEVNIGRERVGLLKPQTYMNLSGVSARLAALEFDLSPSQIIAAYDDVALPAGRLRLRPFGSDGGHKGMRSLIEHLHSDQIRRIRVGVGKPEFLGQMPDFVLSAPSGSKETELFNKTLEAAADAAEMTLEKGFDAAMNRFNPLEISL